MTWIARWINSVLVFFDGASQFLAALLAKGLIELARLANIVVER